MPGKLVVTRPPVRDLRDIPQWIAECTHENADRDLVDQVEERQRTEVDQLILDWIRRTEHREAR